MNEESLRRPIDASANYPRVGFTVLEMLIVVSIIGIVAGLLLPALGAARETARRVQCISHLREVGLAMHHHHSAKRELPAGWTYDSSGSSAYGWAVPLLPYLEQTALAGQINGKLPLDDPRNDKARETALPIMLCPSDITQPMFTLYEDEEEDDDDEGPASIATASDVTAEPAALIRLPTVNYVGMFGSIEADDDFPIPIGDGAFIEKTVRRFRDFQRGLSNTMVVGERTMAQVPSTWIGINIAGEDATARLVGSALEGINDPLADECDYSSRHPGGANFLWGDGHVSFVSENVDLVLYHHWSKLRDN